MRLPAFLAAAALLAASAGPAAADQIQTYIALGDSLAFGETTVIPVSHGDQGYVKLFADWMATQNHGVRPNVVNLAIPGELSSTYFTGDNPPGWTRQVGAASNLNYANQINLSQQSLFLATVAAEKAAGHAITTVSFALGANDLFYLAGSPAFASASPAARQQMLQQAFNTIVGNYAQALTQIRAVLPDAKLLLPNYYNPYAFLPPNDPNNQLAAAFTKFHSQLVMADAALFQGRAVDIAAPFLGHELAYTSILSGSIHPNALGYSVIAQQVEAAAVVPEPGALTLLAAGLASLAGYGWRRARSAGVRMA
jgi:lysophospholipase L1-like esterase